MLKDLHEKLQKHLERGNPFQVMQVLGMCEEGAEVKAARALIPNA